MSVQTERRAMRAGSQKLCWGAAWLRCRQCQCKPNAERWELALKSYAEVQPDFAVGNVSANRMQNLKTCFRKLCWGAAWLRCKQRYNMHNPKSKFLGLLISHLESFPALRMCIQPFIYGHFGAFFIREKKWNRDITFYLLMILKTYEAATFYFT